MQFWSELIYSRLQIERVCYYHFISSMLRSNDKKFDQQLFIRQSAFLFRPSQSADRKYSGKNFVILQVCFRTKLHNTKVNYHSIISILKSSNAHFWLENANKHIFSIDNSLKIEPVMRAQRQFGMT